MTELDEQIASHVAHRLGVWPELFIVEIQYQDYKDGRIMAERASG